ncbi:MAG: maleylpyruvate isomerase N-terminal domain-containing protein [Propioniciclava sp.]|uniref:maleylpyruvate isomerase N-terminal domain-containing protein n=1 Tax=Propioniciclava sp. TaxID=2038686 RepID=UPI0039E47F5B
MVEVQDFREMGEALGNACAVLRSNAASAGLDAEVPNCPGWRVRDLVTHMGVVHRWSAAFVTKSKPRPEKVVEAEAAASADLLDWFDDGMVELLNAFASAPEDLDIRFFLHDAPPPRDAWLRRMVHETTIHAADTIAARLGRSVTAAELWVPAWLAADGVDELLTGAVPRRTDPPALAVGEHVLVHATDAARAWLLTGGDERTSATRVEEVKAPLIAANVDQVIEGSAAAVYLALWNRGSSVGADDAWWRGWRERVTIVWS